MYNYIMDYDFLSEIYDKQYNTYREDLHFYSKISENGKKILEIGSGTGRISLYLARQGHLITGLEPSIKMSKIAIEKAQKENLSLNIINKKIEEFKAKEEFDVIIAPFNALMHLYTVEQQINAFKNIFNALKTGGIFAFDLYLPNYGLENVLRHEGETIFHRNERTDIFILQKIDKIKQIAYTDYFVDTANEKGLNRKFYSLKQRYFSQFEIELLLKISGFNNFKINGSFAGGILNDQSEIMTFQAIK